MNLEERVDWFVNQCRKRGIKITPQRVAIYRELSSTDEHPSAENIYNRIRKYYPNMSLTTVYRTLETFEQLGLISVVNTLSNAARYDANLEPHTHIVCVVCKKIKDVYDLNPDAIDFRDEAGYEVVGYDLLIKGVCPECNGRTL